MRTSKYSSLFLTAALLLLAGLLTGCAGKNDYYGSRGDFPRPGTLGRSLSQSGQNGSAGEYLKKDTAEMSASELEKAGDGYLSRRNFHMAYLNYEKALEKDPGKTEIHYKKGVLFLVSKKYEK
ncbi:MAG: tetratricopeptide repeat protein, partial [Desulfosalsimonas sp.]